MKQVTFKSDFRYPKSALVEVRYRGGKAYTVSNEIAEHAEKAGVLEAPNGSGKSASKGSDDPVEG